MISMLQKQKLYLQNVSLILIEFSILFRVFSVFSLMLDGKKRAQFNYHMKRKRLDRHLRIRLRLRNCLSFPPPASSPRPRIPYRRPAAFSQLASCDE